MSVAEGGRRGDCGFSLMLGNVQTHLESTGQVTNPWHSEEIVCGLEKTKPPPSSLAVPCAGMSPDLGCAA